MNQKNSIEPRPLTQAWFSDIGPAFMHLPSATLRDVLSGRHAEAGWGDSNCGMPKLALIAMTKIWAREEEGDIAVDCCCPGYLRH